MGLVDDDTTFEVYVTIQLLKFTEEFHLIKQTLFLNTGM